MNNSEQLLINAHKMLLLSSMESFTCKMFEFVHKTPYVLGLHHRIIFNALDNVVKGKTRKLIINIAPRYGKTEICSKMFIAYGLALNPKAKFLHLSYSSGLTQENSMAVKDIINSEYYQLLFNTHIRQGMNTRSKWQTTQDGGMYATSTLGQITGFGAGRVDKLNSSEDKLIDQYTATFNKDNFAGAIVIDDPIKPQDALSDRIREQVNNRFETTIRNRVNSRKTPIIIIMQRLHEHDLCGYLNEVEPNQWTTLSIPCIQYDKDNQPFALWEFKHSLEELDKIRNANEFVFQTQYLQNPMPLEGLLYREFLTYETLPEKGDDCIYCDSADTGEDYLCAIAFRKTKTNNYITDVLYTQKPMEETEPLLANMIKRNNTKHVFIESNNGGRIFRRNVERIIRESGSFSVNFYDKTQRENKMVRLFTKANEVNNITLMPKNWEHSFSDFYLAIKTFRKQGRNFHDDAPDALTGTYECRELFKKSNLNIEEFFY